ncbi:hypothetical protein [Planctomicrobium sp. SH527]|uniref:hypothetical protein n=1 Tax=Planctomicrobium sp. SH527 TaxID=3448123 RepID=UPI003F5B047E
MKHRIRNSPLCLLMTIACLGAGCGQTPIEQPVAVNIEVRLDHPLTHAEVALFLDVVREFPGETVPPFSSMDLPSLRHNAKLLEQVRQLRLAIRDALSPERQGQEWRQDARLSSMFRRLNLEPEVFAVLSLKLSSAWSAQGMLESARSPESRQQIDRNITESALKLLQLDGSESQDSPANADLVAQQLIVLEELIALSEFLALTAQVSEESLDVIAAHKEELASTLPHVGTGLSMAAEIR